MYTACTDLNGYVFLFQRKSRRQVTKFVGRQIRHKRCPNNSQLMKWYTGTVLDVLRGNVEIFYFYSFDSNKIKLPPISVLYSVTRFRV